MLRWNTNCSTRAKRTSHLLKSYQYTVDGDRAAEHQFAGDRGRLAKDASHIWGTELCALVLVGGYARGEGGVVIREGKAHPYNDYDLIAVVHRRRPPLLQQLHD